MLTVGLTGGIGSGKSAVARVLAGRGAAVVDADVLAREVLAPGSPGLVEVVAAFGPRMLGADGALDRPRLGALVFRDEQARQELNAITHPRIGERTMQLMAEAERAAEASEDPARQLLVHDVPLLVENGLAPGYHLVLVVDAPVELRLDRLAGRGLAREDAGARMAAQATEDQRRVAADVWLDNSQSLRALDSAVDRLLTARLLPYARNLRAASFADRPALTLTPPDPTWELQARRLVARLRHLAPDAAAVEHIGSTAVGGLPAKDVLDLQVTMSDWAAVEALRAPLAAGGFPRREDIDGDPPRPQLDPDPAQWRKRLHRNADPGRQANVHVRIAGSTAAQAAIEFRDRLRADPAARATYAELKARLVRKHGQDVDAYAEGKTDFVIGLLSGAGEQA